LRGLCQFSLSLSEISVLNWIPKGHTFVVLESYFDGGNKADSVEYDVLTLAAISGNVNQLRRFERAWKKNLVRHRCDYIHTTDLVSLQNYFDRDKGWNESKRDALLLDCVKIAGKHFARPITQNDPTGRLGLFPHTITVDLKAFVRARSENSDVARTADEICAVQSLDACMEWGSLMETTSFELVFDQGEPFYGHVHDRIVSKRARRDLPFLERIVDHTQSPSCRFPALQLADLLAWCVNHKEAERPFKWQKRLLANPRVEEFAGYPELVKPLAKHVSLTRSWKLPKRALHR
jgi:hypothetical protein